MSSPIEDGPPFGPIVNGTMVVFWEYRPSNVAGYLFLALFALATLLHLVYFVWLRAWLFIPFILGGVCLFFGYHQRAVAHAEPDKLRPWLLQNMLLLVAPPLLAATVYMSYGRVAAALLEGVLLHHHPGSRSRGGKDRDRNCCARCCVSLFCTCSATRAYVLADLVAIFTQLIGTVLPASGTPEALRLSRIVVVAGLLAQLLALGAFLVSCGRLHARLRRARRSSFGSDTPLSWAMAVDPGVNWLGYLVVLEVATATLVVRSVVRGAEYLGGADGFVASQEAFVYVFDAVPMLVCMAGFLLLHPARLVREVARLEERFSKAEGRGESAELRERPSTLH